MALGLIVIASVGKFAGAFIGGEIGGLSRREALALACGMNARGSTEVIVATIGLSMGALSQNLFTMIVAMAVVTTMAMPPMLRWALARVPMAKAEKDRLEREELEAKELRPQPRAPAACGGRKCERQVCGAARRADRRSARLADDGVAAYRKPARARPSSALKPQGKDAESGDRAGEAVKAAAEEGQAASDRAKLPLRRST